MSSLESNPSSNGGEIHVLTLTPFYPSRTDDAVGCFVAEPLACLAKLGVVSTVVVAQPWYRGKEQNNAVAPAADWVRYLAVPGGRGLASAGAFLFAGILSRVRELHHRRKIDIIHAHAPLPCGHAAMLLGRELDTPFVVSVHGLDAYSTNQVSGHSRKMVPPYQRPSLSFRLPRDLHQRACSRRSSARRPQVTDVRRLQRRFAGTVLALNRQLREPRPQSSPSATSSPSKGHDVLIRAVAAISAAHPNLQLQIVGDGPERTRLTSLAADTKN